MKEPLYGLKIEFLPEIDDDGNAVRTIENIELLRPNGDILAQLSGDSCSFIYWRAPLGCQIIGDWSIAVSRPATIKINPPLEDFPDGW